MLLHENEVCPIECYNNISITITYQVLIRFEQQHNYGTQRKLIIAAVLLMRRYEYKN